MANFSKFLYAAFIFLGVFAAAGGMGGQASAEPITITDIDGRAVSVNTPVQKIVLGEGRFIYALSVLDKDNPFQRVVGWLAQGIAGN